MMTNMEPLSPDQAASLFSDVMHDSNGLHNPLDILAVWTAFKKFCAVPVECSESGFIFNAGFIPTFASGKRELDFTRYQVGFTRYWDRSTYGTEGTYLAECSLECTGIDSLREYEWIDIDAEGSTHFATEREDALDAFVKETEDNVDLWILLRSLSFRNLEFYCGLQ